MLQSAGSAIVQTLLTGGNQGTAFNDLILLGWPATNALNITNPIASIAVYHGWVVDTVDITYQLANGTTKVIQHGARAGGVASVTQLAEDEVLVDVYGKAGYHPYYQANLVCQISFVILNTQTGTVRLAGPFGNGDGANIGALFHDAGPLAFAGFENTTASEAGLFGLSFLSSEAWV